MASRIIFDVKQGDTAEQGDELEFIVFVSRVDLYLPLTFKPTIAQTIRLKGIFQLLANFSQY